MKPTLLKLNFKQSPTSFILGVLIAFFPKCAFCWAAYMSIFSALGFATLPYLDWLLPVLSLFFVLNIFSLGIVARKRGQYAPFLLSFSGGVMIMLAKLFLNAPFFMMLGLFFIIAASLVNLFSKKLVCKLPEPQQSTENSFLI